MANIAIFKTGETPKYLKSVNTSEYVEDSDVLINPDISQVESVPLKYWKREGDLIAEMTIVQKQVIDDLELQDRKSSADTYAVGMKEALTALIKVINLRLNGGQKITKQEMIDALKGEIL